MATPEVIITILVTATMATDMVTLVTATDIQAIATATDTDTGTDTGIVTVLRIIRPQPITLRSRLLQPQCRLLPPCVAVRCMVAR